MIQFVLVKIDLLDPWKFNESTKLLVRNESDLCALVSRIDEILSCKEVGVGIFDMLVTIISCFIRG